MVPKNWGYFILGNISLVVTSGSRDWARYYSTFGSKFIRMTNLNRNGIDLLLNDLRYVLINSKSHDGKRTLLQHGDILISITAELGKIGWVPNDLGEAYINQHTAMVRIDPGKAESKFIAYQLSSNRLNKIINSLNDAGAKAGLNLSTIKSIPVLLPPLTEQKKIAQILSTWDKAITTTEKLLANSEQQKKALMQQLLTGKKRFSGFFQKWEHAKLKSLAKISKGYQLNRSTLTKTGKYPVINGGITPSGYSETANWPGNSITISEGGNSCGYVSYQKNDFWCGGHCYVLSNLKLPIQLIYQLLKFNESKIMRLRVGSGLPNIQKKDLDSLITYFPTNSMEQKKIASLLLLSDQEIENIKQELNCLKQEKKALMQQLLTGKRRVKI